MKNISIKNIYVLLLLPLLFNYGCSFIEKSSHFENNSYKDWKCEYYYSFGRECYFLNKYENENYTLYVIPKRLQNKRILFGPAYFLTFIPNIFNFWPESYTPRYAEKFSIKIIIKNKSDKIIADLSKITFEFDGDFYNPQTKKVDANTALNLEDTLSVNKYIHSWWVDSMKTRFDSSNCLKVIEFNNNKLETEREHIAIQYEFDYETIRINEINICFNNFILEPKNSEIPNLKLSNENYYEYIPFEFGH